MTPRAFDVQFTQGALADVERIHDYIAATYAPTAADQFIDDVQAAIDALRTFPERGSVPRDLEELGIVEYRQRPVGAYRAIYQVVGNRIIVVLVAHERQRLQTLLAQRLVRP